MSHVSLQALQSVIVTRLELFRNQTNITVPFNRVSGRAIIVTHSVLKHPLHGTPGVTGRPRRHPNALGRSRGNYNLLRDV